MYIAADTPPEVCAFLTELKSEGDFSYEVLQIIKAHVLANQSAPPGADVTLHPIARSAPVGSAAAPTHSAVEQPIHRHDPVPATMHSTETGTSTPVETPSPKPDPIQLLRQQRRAWVSGAQGTSTP